MASLRVSLNVNPLRKLVDRLGVGARVVAEPMLGQRGKRFVGLARFGEGGVRQQFADERGQTERGAEAWPKTKAFNRRPAPQKTLQVTGAYRSAWLGGAGSVERINARSFELGVDSTLFPQVVPFQSARGRRAKVTKAMRGFLGYAFGVWLKKSTRFILIPRRVVGIGAKVKKTIAAALKDEVLKAYRQQVRRSS